MRKANRAMRTTSLVIQAGTLVSIVIGVATFGVRTGQLSAHVSSNTAATQKNDARIDKLSTAIGDLGIAVAHLGSGTEASRANVQRELDLIRDRIVRLEDREQ